MFSARQLFTATALIGATLGLGSVTPAKAGVVVKSSGPSAAEYPVGKKLDDAASVTLRDGDAITVLTGAGTRILRGPGTHRVGARGASKRTAFAMLTRQRSGARVRTGAVRGGTGDAMPHNSNLWNVDVTQAGKVCLATDETIGFWRPSLAGEETWVLGSAVSDFHVHVTFADGDATASLGAEELPLGQNRIYGFSGPDGGPAQRVEFVLLETVPDNPEDLAVALAQNGCNGQLDLLSERLAG
ncbi:hypothetical protein [Qipengyuania zhejiangensis]|uniref:hypothetical protein n=1 Tax=Qipengyuania zhejiangensis TaxID=3077782 RepID=UPI002D78EAA8|nr:hypothetical protein [Qipengyuania sp. Z2]